MGKKILNASEMGKLGGRKRAEMAGSKGMAEIAKIGRENLRKNDPDFYKRLSKAGVAARNAKKKEALKSSTDKFADLLRGKK